MLCRGPASSEAILHRRACLGSKVQPVTGWRGLCLPLTHRWLTVSVWGWWIEYGRWLCFLELFQFWYCILCNTNNTRWIYMNILCLFSIFRLCLAKWEFSPKMQHSTPIYLNYIKIIRRTRCFTATDWANVVFYIPGGTGGRAENRHFIQWGQMDVLCLKSFFILTAGL